MLFRSSALGFSTEIWHEDDGYAWVYPGATRDGISIDYTLAEDHDPFSTATMVYLAIPDVNAIYEAIRHTGVARDSIDDQGLPVLSSRDLRDLWHIGGSLARVSRPITQSWGKLEVALFDPDNNLIRIGSAL